MRNQGGFREEIERSREIGRPTESLGRQILAFSRSMARISAFGLSSSQLDDAVSFAVYKCLRGWRNIAPEWSDADTANYLAKSVQNALRDHSKEEGRRKRREAIAAEDLRPDRSYSRKGPR